MLEYLEEQTIRDEWLNEKLQKGNDFCRVSGKNQRQVGRQEFRKQWDLYILENAYGYCCS